MKRKKNIVKIVIVALLSLFAILNITWFSYIYTIYVPYKDVLSKASFGHYYGLKNDCGIGVTYPMYLDFKKPGNISLTYSSEEGGISLLIWPSTWLGSKEYSYGLSLYENTEEDGISGLTQRTSMYVDENGYPIEQTKDNIRAYETNKALIDFIFQSYHDLI